ncbi:MAG TPA: right-handed parallel beta-helix repeat-containing protein [Phycisphaerae bacterium]|nr:right-handed parallel beta-helix repeat-containing protein [Phycisphaerae bacterium]
MAALIVAAISGGALAGDLNPPAGAVAPTHKTLTEVEPRIAVNATNTPADTNSIYRITQPGSYYLTGNITGVSAKNGIKFAASGVTLDLMGFEIVGVAGSLDGILVSGNRTNISVANGTVRGWGGDGIDAATATVAGLERLKSYQNGGIGIKLGGNGMIVECTGHLNTGAGISTTAGTLLDRCVATSNTGSGIIASEGSVVAKCVARGNSAHGIDVTNHTLVEGCIVTLNGTGGTNAGIHVNGSGNRIDGNHVSNSDSRGIRVAAAGNVIVRNSVRSSTVQAYDIAAGNDYAQILTLPGAGFTSSVAWANFSDQAPTCVDGIQNGSETGVDCGGGTCPPCGAGQGCLAGSDCVSGICSGGICQP